MNNVITVGISDMKVTSAPSVLVTYALGSCVGICLYDSFLKIAGLAHIMLPCDNHKNAADNKYKYADICIPMMYHEMIKLGCNKGRLVAKIAGGASMFQVSGDNEISNIGNRNVESTKNVLKSLKVPIVAEDTGSNYGRTVWFYSSTGAVEIKSYAHQPKIL